MKFYELAAYLEKLEALSSRIEITTLLSEVFKKSDKDEIDKIVYLLLGRLAPSYKGIVFNLADKLVLHAAASAFEAEEAKVQALYKKTGDIGQVCYILAEKQKTKTEAQKETVSGVYESLLTIAQESGEGSVEKKVEGLADILRSVNPLSAKFIARIPVGKLRLGFSDKTIIDALSWMEVGGKEKSATISKTYEVLPDIGLIASEVKEKGIDKATKNVVPKVGVPIMPMLAQRVKSAEEMIKKMGNVYVEPKYDGLRVLIHFKKGKEMKVFTRNLNDISSMFPELENLAHEASAYELILDSEAVGLDEETKGLADFQTTMQRRRKHEITVSASKIPLVFNLFDILYIDGQSLIDKPYAKRREILSQTFKKSNIFKITPYVATSDPEVIRSEYKKCISEGLEGILVKKADSEYIPGRTGFRWVKMKQSEESVGKLTDTLDCVIMGFTAGQGKRVSFGVGQFLVGVREGEKIKTITKVGTGLSDEQFKELKKRLSTLVIKEKPLNYEVHKDLSPDFWVTPEIVVELAGDDLTVSPKHAAGYALRFPRLVKFRDDKSVDQATTVTEVKKMYKLQKS